VNVAVNCMLVLSTLRSEGVFVRGVDWLAESGFRRIICTCRAGNQSRVLPESASGPAARLGNEAHQRYGEFGALIPVQ